MPLFKVEVLEVTPSNFLIQNQVDALNSDFYQKNVGDIVTDSLLNVGFFDVLTNTVNTTAGYSNTGWLDWDGVETVVRYTGRFNNAAGMGCADENGDIIYHEGGVVYHPQFNSDVRRVITIPSGTRKIIFSCQDSAQSTFKVSIVKKPNVYKKSIPAVHKYRSAAQNVGSQLGNKFYMKFSVRFGNLNVDAPNKTFANICGHDLQTISAKPTTYETETVGFLTNHPIPKLKSGFTAIGGQNKIPTMNEKRIVGEIQFSIKYTGVFSGNEDIYITFDGTTLTIGKEAGSLILYSYTCNSLTKISQVIDDMKINLNNFEVIDYFKDCLTSELLTFNKVYLVSKFASVPERRAGTERLDAFRFNFRKAICDDIFDFEVYKSGLRLLIFINGSIWCTDSKTFANSYSFFESSGDCKIFDIEVHNNSLNKVELLPGNVLVSDNSPIILTLMLHSVYKCREVDGGNLETLYPDLKPYPNAYVPMSIGRLERILATAKKRGYTIVSSEQVDAFMNGKQKLPRRSLCLIHDDKERYIYTDESIASIYESYNAKGSCALIVDGEDYGNVPQRMRADGWGALSHFKQHTNLHTLNSDTLYNLCKESIENCKASGVYGNSLVYPGGGISQSVMEALEITGYTSAWITTGVYTSKLQSKFRMRRFGADDLVLWQNIEPLFI